MWGMLPIGSQSTASILRLDHVLTIRADPANWTTEPHVLSHEALAVLDEWLSWLTTGLLRADTGLAFARANLPDL